MENRVKGQEWNTRLAAPHGNDPVRAPISKVVSQVLIWLSLGGYSIEEGMALLVAGVRERLAETSGFKTRTDGLLDRLGISEKQFKAGSGARDYGDFLERLGGGR
jgi:hypothetical protein